MSRYFLAALFAVGAIFGITPAKAVDGQVLITHSKALAGNVTPGDTAGYPVRLSVPGSYALASNLSPGPNRDGIVAASADISINLNGFTISGGPAGGTNNSLRGIVGLGDRLTVKNGTIGAFETAGIYAPDRPYLIVENTRIINSGLGIYNQNGQFARIQNSTIATNKTNGIVCGVSCQVEGNVVSGNGATGILIISGMVLGNTIFVNGGFGVNFGGGGPVSGFGNNTIINNVEGQVFGSFISLQPNACAPIAC